MKQELEDKLAAKYPEQFAERNLPPEQSCMAFGCEFSDGWEWLIDTMCMCIQEEIDNKKEDGVVIDFQWTQLKEKFGQLRAYFVGGNDYIDGIVRLGEALSYHICEYCGKPGKERGSSWIKTLCDECDAKSGGK